MRLGRMLRVWPSPRYAVSRASHGKMGAIRPMILRLKQFWCWLRTGHRPRRFRGEHSIAECLTCGLTYRQQDRDDIGAIKLRWGPFGP